MASKIEKDVSQILQDLQSQKKQQKEKTGSFWFILAVIILNCYTIMQVTDLTKIVNRIELAQQNVAAETAAISLKVSADELDKLNMLKVQKNLEVWRETGCIQCHNTAQLALPINKITITEAVKIVREGSSASLEGGMPKYSARNSRTSDSITDSELQVRFDQLYTKEFLRTANEQKKTSRVVIEAAQKQER